MIVKDNMPNPAPPKSGYAPVSARVGEPSGAQPMAPPPTYDSTQSYYTTPTQLVEPAGRRFWKALIAGFAIWILIGMLVRSIVDLAVVHRHHRNGVCNFSIPTCSQYANIYTSRALRKTTQSSRRAKSGNVLIAKTGLLASSTRRLRALMTLLPVLPLSTQAHPSISPLTPTSCTSSRAARSPPDLSTSSTPMPPTTLCTSRSAYGIGPLMRSTVHPSAHSSAVRVSSMVLVFSRRVAGLGERCAIAWCSRLPFASRRARMRRLRRTIRTSSFTSQVFRESSRLRSST